MQAVLQPSFSLPDLPGDPSIGMRFRFQPIRMDVASLHKVRANSARKSGTAQRRQEGECTCATRQLSSPISGHFLCLLSHISLYVPCDSCLSPWSSQCPKLLALSIFPFLSLALAVSCLSPSLLSLSSFRSLSLYLSLSLSFSLSLGVAPRLCFTLLSPSRCSFSLFSTIQ
jgi:hypothetical protein